LKALVARPSDAPRWNGPYIQGSEVPVDPWGRPYQYRRGEAGRAFVIVSLGADGAEGGDGENADIQSK
jgi:general secretion pathway protein G